MRRFRLILASIAFALANLAPLPVHAQILSSLTIEQLSADKLGVWTLLEANGSSITSTDKDVNAVKYTAGISTFGQMVLRSKPPPGMVAKISVYRGGDLVLHTESQQYAFTLLPNDTYRFIIQYRMANLGSLGIISELKSVIFRVKSSDGRIYRGITPWGRDLPIGKYTVYSNPLPGCFRPAPLNITVKAEERNTATISQTCEDATDDITVLRIRPSKRDILNEAIKRNAIRAARH